MEDEDETLANSIKANLYSDSPLSAKCCIFRVPEVLRRSYENVYEPDIVAIGPFHRGKKILQPMENVKRWYLESHLKSMNINILSLIKGIKELEKDARECYQEPIELNQRDFIEMMIIDGFFLIQLFRKEADFDLRSKDDPIFNMACMHKYLYHDLLLLENQLPWFILETLFNLIKPNDHKNFSLIELVLNFFRTYFSMTNRYETRFRMDIENLHILDLIRHVLVSSYSDADHTSTSIDKAVEDKPDLIPCVTRLLGTGVIFTKGSPDSMMNIEFENGIFVVPPLSIHETTEPLFRNLIAFEQCYHSCDNKITSYAILMDSLINTSRDVEYLSEQGIIDNWLSAEDASHFFNRLYINTFVTDFYYAKLCKRVNSYYKTKWHRWKATLMRDYFRTPWTIISILAACLLLALVVLHTFYTIKLYYSYNFHRIPHK
ncbi:hypothetical protein FNV43_RR22298 [Rhamnella rubrinervis]|uniref:Uncharacterized protein n=1 Tax=Rhamnella rubrinervis TaxID=2594499 RepID=A0A8K0DUY3_9ROSA|nr:hypothetical protein FNV43_RR22298 [Rhamnella rubrinervis]